MNELLGAATGALGGLMAYTVARLLLNGKYMSRDNCQLRHSSIEADIREVKESILRLENLLIDLMRQRRDAQ